MVSRIGCARCWSRSTAPTGRGRGGGPIEAGCTSGRTAPIGPSSSANDTLTFTPGAEQTDPEYVGMLGAGYTPDGKLLLFAGATKPPLPSCLSDVGVTVQPSPAT